MDTVLALDGPAFCEIFTDTKQVWGPRAAPSACPTARWSAPVGGPGPFLPREELEKQMFIPLMPEV